MSDVSSLDEAMSALAAQTPEEDLASAKGAAGVEAPDAKSVTIMHAPEPIDDIEDVRGVWWSLARQGQHLPAQHGVILIDGFQSTKLPAKRRE